MKLIFCRNIVVFHFLWSIHPSRVKRLSLGLVIILVNMVRLVLYVVIVIHLFYFVKKALKDLLLRYTIAVAAAAYKALPIKRVM
jgi:hypothetical protein